MQFTPQQMAGGARFSPVTRIGNWQEELSLEEAKVANFYNKSSDGNLSLRKLENKINKCSEIVPHTYSPDGIIRFGDSIILEHISSGSILACDPFEEVVVGQGKFYVSTLAQKGPAEPKPMARNTFRVVRPPKQLQNFSDTFEDDILHIGQSFMLACDDALLVQADSKLLAPTLYLASTKKNERMATRRSNKQLVYMSADVNSEAVWSAVLPSQGKTNASARFLAMGQPLTVEDNVLFTHRQTNQYLSCDPQGMTATEFGVEFEAFGDRSTAYGKLSLVVSEAEGLSTSQTLAKPDAPTFSWRVITSSEPPAEGYGGAEEKYGGEEAEGIAMGRTGGMNSTGSLRNLPPPATVENVLLEVQDAIKARGVDAFWNLREFFRQFENKTLSTGKIDREDLKACLREWGLSTPSPYLDSVVDLCDADQLGLVDLRDFMRVVQGPMARSREDALDAAFACLDAKSSAAPPGYVAMGDLAVFFKGQEHPMVTIGGYSEEEALDHLLKSVSSVNTHRRAAPPKQIGFDRFCEYYSDLSAAIDDDEYFNGIVRSNWAPAMEE